MAVKEFNFNESLSRTYLHRQNQQNDSIQQMSTIADNGGSHDDPLNKTINNQVRFSHFEAINVISSHSNEANTLSRSANDQQSRRLSGSVLGASHATTHTSGDHTTNKQTLVVYSGPTSLNRSIGKNDIYLNNFDYFLENGIECDGRLNQLADEEPTGATPNLHYVVVLTQEVADRYQAEDGLLTRRQRQCAASLGAQHGDAVGDAPIKVLIREDRCYDMESILLVLRTIDVQSSFDHLVYINCGLAGPRFGPGSPENWENLSSWTELYTSLLSDKVQMVGQTINTHYQEKYAPHVQSFLFAANSSIFDILLTSGAIYDCGITNEELADPQTRMELVWRYEVGMSRVILEHGYSIAAAFMNQGGRFGTPLIINGNSTIGSNIDPTTSDLFKEDGLRRLTAATFPHWWRKAEEQERNVFNEDVDLPHPLINVRRRFTHHTIADHDEYQKHSILPWDHYVFFKVSRLVPYDIQNVMHYEHLGKVPLIPNDPRRSPQKYWRRKVGVSIWDERWEKWFGLSYTMGDDDWDNLSTVKYQGIGCDGHKGQFDFAYFSLIGRVLIVLLSVGLVVFKNLATTRPSLHISRKMLTKRR